MPVTPPGDDHLWINSNIQSPSLSNRYTFASNVKGEGRIFVFEALSSDEGLGDRDVILKGEPGHQFRGLAQERRITERLFHHDENIEVGARGRFVARAQEP